MVSMRLHLSTAEAVVNIVLAAVAGASSMIGAMVAHKCSDLSVQPHNVA